MKKFLVYTIIILSLLNAVIILSGNTFIYKTIYYNFADIDDNKIFEQRKVETQAGIEWPLSGKYNKINAPDYLIKQLENLESIAFLVIQDDSVLYEKYWDGYAPDKKSNSFSIAKSIVGILTGIAIDEHHIKNIDQAVGDFLPSFRTGKKSKLTIRHLLSMSAGFDWNEAYANPISSTSKAYYGSDLPSMVNNLDVIEEPGKIFRYQSISTEVLGMVIEKATSKSLSQYASEKLWKPLHAMYDAEWSLDKKDGMEKSYCCFFSGARDFARIGSLFLHNGNFMGQQIVSAEWVKNSTSLSPLSLKEQTKNDCYGLAWWIIPDYKGHYVYYARGILGQYIIVVPDKKTVIVRLGKMRGQKVGYHLDDIFIYLDGAFDLIKKQ